MPKPPLGAGPEPVLLLRLLHTRTGTEASPWPRGAASSTGTAADSFIGSKVLKFVFRGLSALTAGYFPLLVVKPSGFLSPDDHVPR